MLEMGKENYIIGASSVVLAVQMEYGFTELFKK